MTPKRLGLFIFLSIVLHLFLLLGFQYIAPLLPKPSEKTESKSVRVTLVQPPKPAPPPLQPSKPVPKETQFVETANLPTAKEADPNTPLESDNTTKAASVKPGEGSEFLPSQQGVNVPGINLHNSVASVENKTQPTPPTPKPDEKESKEEPQQKQETKNQPDPAKPEDPKEKPPQPQVKPIDPIPLRPDGNIELAKVQPPDPPKPSPEVSQKPQQPVKNATPRSPPAEPTQFSAFKQQNSIDGGAAQGSSPSVASRETELGRYKAKLFRGIGSRWYLYVQQDNGLLGVGNVKIRFYVRSDGVITNLEILQGKQNAQLAAISRRSIMEISGQLEPFSDSLKVQLGEGYFEEVTFSIY